MVGTAQVLSMTDDLRNSFLGSVLVIFVLVWLPPPRAAWRWRDAVVPRADAAVLGVMVALGITLRPLTVISFCVALGLMIDDTIHLTARFREERAPASTPTRPCSARSTRPGRPVVITTLVLLVGFVTILGSGFRGTFTFGLLVDLSLLGRARVGADPAAGAAARVRPRPRLNGSHRRATMHRPCRSCPTSRSTRSASRRCWWATAWRSCS